MVYSIILYGAPVWQEALTVKKYKTMISGTQRKAPLQIALKCRIVSTADRKVITGIPPIAL